MSLSQQFFANTLKKFPDLHSLISIVGHRENLFILNYPIQVQSEKETKPSSKINYFLKNGSNYIPKNNHLFLYPLTKTFTSMSFQGANLVQQQKLNQSIRKLKETQIQSQEFFDHIKILIQIYATNLESRILQQATTNPENSDPLKLFGNYLYNKSKQDFSEPFVDQKTANCIGSMYLKKLATSQPKQMENMYKIIKQNILKNISLQQFKQIERLIRAKAFRVGSEGHASQNEKSTKALVMAPFLDFFGHSFQANCKFTGLYMTHLRQSFISIKSVRDISPGEPLTFLRGNFNNYEMFFKYGEVYPNNTNPNRESYIIIALQKVPQIFQQYEGGLSIEWKQEMLFSIGQKMKSIIRVRPDGLINSKDYRVLEILFAQDNKDYYDQQKRESVLKKKIYSFVRNEAVHNLSFIKNQMIKSSADNSLIKLSHPKVDYLQNEQIENIERFIEKSKAHL